MWRELLNAPWPDAGDLPKLVQEKARSRIRRYWRRQIWLQIIVGETFLWVIAESWHIPHANAYAIPLVLVSAAYFLGLIPNLDLIWMIGLVVLFAVQGMWIRGIG